MHSVSVIILLLFCFQSKPKTNKDSKAAQDKNEGNC